ncbi:MAG: 50S ribosomal protein L2 [Chlamydiae bacterium]|nr:50S ribosomal protein L2 [Chlamydiota bacterium]MBI3277735.1 50S ribosomal protein L2 [Chlamydiota bacterium]
MALKTYNPVTPTRRFTTGYTFEEITKDRPEKNLVERLGRTGGRNSQGRLTMRHRGGGYRKVYRIIDFKREKFNIPARVVSIEYDPNRSCRIALLSYADGEKRYILAPLGLKVNDVLVTSDTAEPKIGNCMKLSQIPLGTFLHNIELVPGKGGQLVRSAGSSAQLMAREANFAHVRLPSKEIRLVRVECRATLGQLSNPDHMNISLGKAGRMRWKGRRSIVRGVAMNPVDHPLGGGEGKANGGRQHCSPWGLIDGTKTRKRSKASSKYILERRKK